MRRVASMSGLALLLSVPLIAGGCVQQEKYDALLMSNRSLQEQLVTVEDERDVAKANLDTVRDQLGKATGELNGLKSKYGLVDADLAKLLADNEALMKRISVLDIGPLPEEMSAALEALAKQYPDLLTFDAKRGLVRFASDFTFDSGSADLKSNASAGLAALAQILNTSTASGFEAHVVGHTDNVPVSNPNTRAKHPTNVYLSVHRSISVRDALVHDGVSAERVMVAGWGEFRPAVDNVGKGGTAQNRRVEIYLTPMTDHATVAAAPVKSAPKKAAVDTDEPMK
jgi:chemotaxis protein MotB